MDCKVCQGTGKIQREVRPKVYLLTYRSCVLHNDAIPEGAKELALRLLDRMIPLFEQITGNIELSYRRGMQDNKLQSKGLKR